MSLLMCYDEKMQILIESSSKNEFKYYQIEVSKSEVKKFYL